MSRGAEQNAADVGWNVFKDSQDRALAFHNVSGSYHWRITMASTPKKLDAVKRVNAALATFAAHPTVQKYIKRPTVQAALAIWSGKPSPAGMSETEIEDCDGVAAIYPLVKDIEGICNAVPMKVPVDHMQAGKVKLDNAFLTTMFGAEFCKTNKLLSKEAVDAPSPPSPQSQKQSASQEPEQQQQRQQLPQQPQQPTSEKSPKASKSSTPTSAAPAPAPAPAAPVQEPAPPTSPPPAPPAEPLPPIPPALHAPTPPASQIPAPSAAASPSSHAAPERPASSAGSGTPVAAATAAVKIAAASVTPTSTTPAASTALPAPATERTAEVVHAGAPQQHKGFNMGPTYLMIVVTFVALYFGLQTRPMPDRTSSLPWVGKYNASALIRRQVQFVEDGMVKALSKKGWKMLRRDFGSIADLLPGNRSDPFGHYVRFSALVKGTPDMLVKLFDNVTELEKTHIGVAPFLTKFSVLQTSSQAQVLRAKMKGPLPTFKGTQYTLAHVQKKSTKAVEMAFITMNEVDIPSPLVIPAGTLMVGLVGINAEEPHAAGTGADAPRPLVALCDQVLRQVTPDSSLCSSAASAVTTATTALNEVLEPPPVNVRLDIMYWFLPSPSPACTDCTLMVMVGQGITDMMMVQMSMGYSSILKFKYANRAPQP